MRAAHSLKGAARIVGLTAGVRRRARDGGLLRGRAGGPHRACAQQAYRPAPCVVSICSCCIANTPEADIERWNAEKQRGRRRVPRHAAMPCSRRSDEPRRRRPRSVRATRRTAGALPQSARGHRSRSARHGGEPEPPAGPGRRVAGRVALGRSPSPIRCCGSSGCITTPRERSTACATPCRACAWTTRRRRRSAMRSADCWTASGCWRSGSPSSSCSIGVGQPLASAVRRGAGLPHAAVRRRRSGSSAPGPRSRPLARQAGEAGDRRRGDAGRPRHSRDSSTRRSAICCATPSTTASSRRTSAAPPASRRRACSGSKRVTARVRSRSSSRTTAAASTSKRLRGARHRAESHQCRGRRGAERGRAARVPVPARLSR